MLRRFDQRLGQPRWTLVGTGEPEITFLKGGDWGPDLTRSIFKGGVWDFYESGESPSFRFTPSEGADVREDLYPIWGRHTQTGDTIKFSGETHSGMSSSVSITGLIHMSGQNAILDVVHAIGVNGEQIAKIRQTLNVAGSVAAEQRQTPVGGISAPAKYVVSFNGAVDGVKFDSLPGVVQFMEPGHDDPNPLSVSISTDSQSLLGSILCTSFTRLRGGRGVVNSTVVMDGQGRIALTLVPKPDIVSVAWLDALSGTLLDRLQDPAPLRPGAALNGLISFDVKAMRQATFSGACHVFVTEEQVSGEIHATRIAADGQRSDYVARFTGTRFKR